jgi:hypothetical protein
LLLFGCNFIKSSTVLPDSDILCANKIAFAFLKKETHDFVNQHYHDHGLAIIAKNEESCKWVILKKMKTLCDIEGEISNWTN